RARRFLSPRAPRKRRPRAPGERRPWRRTGRGRATSIPIFVTARPFERYETFLLCGQESARTEARPRLRRPGTGVVGANGRQMRERRSDIIDLPIQRAPIVPAHLTVDGARKIAALKRAVVVLVESGGRLLGLVEARAGRRARRGRGRDGRATDRPRPPSDHV